ncbi:MAG: cupin domain-containing protein [Alphaproteobacteria bacterium]|nr:cupin domain-containing protein [Alphaproteobacteria bacterium]
MLDVPEFLKPAMTGETMREQEAEMAKNRKPSLFSLKGQLLDQGRTDTMLAATEDLTLRLKIYASGGENELHAHTSEDHSFIVLQGSARFFGPEGEMVELTKHQGIMLPKGNYYRFYATSEEPLVMIRVGNPYLGKQANPTRVNAKGEEMKGDSKENKKVETVFREGAYFGD